MGETLIDDDFLTAVEKQFVSLLQAGKPFRAGGLLGHFIWKNSAQYSRPRRLVIARAMTFAGLYEGRGFQSNVRRIIEKLRAQDANSWKLELYAEVVFATVGLGCDPVMLALGVLDWDSPGLVCMDFKRAFSRVQEQAKPATQEEGRPAKRARKDNDGLGIIDTHRALFRDLQWVPDSARCYYRR